MNGSGRLAGAALALVVLVAGAGAAWPLPTPAARLSAGRRRRRSSLGARRSSAAAILAVAPCSAARSAIGDRCCSSAAASRRRLAARSRCPALDGERRSRLLARLLAAAWLLAWLLRRRGSPRSRPPTRRRRRLLRHRSSRHLRRLAPVPLGGASSRGVGVPVRPAAAAERRSGARIVDSLPILAADFLQTFLKAVLAGYAHRLRRRLPRRRSSPTACRSCRRGLLPLGNLVSALPIIGIAPIMVMWFGFDWQSKAAVVVIMTFFPMLVNTRRRASPPSGHMERDLMRTYAAELLADAAQAAPAGGAALHLQRAQDQLDAGADRRHRRRVLRHADRRHGLPHLDRGRPHEHRHGLGGNRGCGARGLRLLWRGRAHRAGRHVLASVLSQ